MTTPASGGGPSPVRLGGLALIGVAVVAAIIGLASMAVNGDPTTTAAPGAPSTTTPAEIAPLPLDPVPTGDATVPVPSYGDVPPGEAPPAEAPPGEAPPAAQAPPAGEEPAPGGTPEAPGAPAPAPGPADGNGEPAPGPAAAAPAAPGGTGGGSARSGDVNGGAAPGNGGASAVRAPLRVYNNSTITGLASRAAEDFRRAGWPIDEVGNYPQGTIPTTTVYFRPGTDEEAPARALGEQFGMRVSPRFEGLQTATPGVIVIVTNDYGR